MAQNIFTSSFLACTTNLVRKKDSKTMERLLNPGKSFHAIGDVLRAGEYPDCSSVKLNFKDTDKDFQLKNAILLYEALPMTPYQASDPRLWTYLTLVTFREYMNSLRPISSETDNPFEYLLRHYFCSSSVKDLLLNDISLLWWSAHLTVSDSHVHKYHLSQEVFTMLDYTRHLLPGTQGRAKQFRHAVLEFAIENQDLFKSHKQAKIRLIMRRLNTRAGFQLFPVFSKQDIKALIMDLRPEIEACKP